MLTSLENKLGVSRLVLLTILVAALGYFVDIFDLLLFSIVRVQSLKDLGVAEEDLLTNGIFLINMQMAGLMIGGFLWGIWGDKMGRVSVLFGSILLYSVANIANGFAMDVNQYAILRLIAGIGLAGELGAGVTLASELLPRHWRGLGTTFIAATGILGAIFAATIADMTSWRTAYFVGGGMGLALLLLRMHVHESDMFKSVKQEGPKISRGNVFKLLRPALFKKYICVILVGAPIWGVVGLLITFSPEFAKAFGMLDIPKAGTAVLASYLGLSIGDMFSGLLSQKLKSRRKAVAIFLSLMVVFIGWYMFAPHPSLFSFYVACFLLGIGSGYWAMFVQMGAEQFGTNIRATAATTIPNMVRGATIPATASFHYLIPTLGVANAGLVVMGVILIAAFVAVYLLEETFHTDLDYTEA
jgi:putative MFS transporter